MCESLDCFPLTFKVIFVKARDLQSCGAAVLLVVALPIPNPVLGNSVIDDSKPFLGKEDRLTLVIDNAIGFVIDADDSIFPPGCEGPEFVTSREWNYGHGFFRLSGQGSLEGVGVAQTLHSHATDSLVFIPVPFLPVGVPALFLDPVFAGSAKLGEKIVNFAEILASARSLARRLQPDAS